MEVKSEYVEGFIVSSFQAINNYQNGTLYNNYSEDPC